MAQSIARNRSFAIEPLGFQNDAGQVGVEGRFYAQYAPGLPVALVPLVLIGQSLARPAEALARFYPYQIPNPSELGPRVAVSYFNAPIEAATAALLAVLVLRLGYPPRAALFTALAYAFATFAWGQARVVFADPLQGLLLLLGCLLLVEASPSRALLGGGALALAMLVKLTSALAVPVLLLLPDADGRPLWRRPAMAARVVGPAIAAVALHALYNVARYGSPLSTGYYSSGGGGLDFGGNPLVGLYGLIISAGRGVIWYAPPILAAVWAWRRFAQGRRHVALAIAALVVVWFVVHALWRDWHGGWSWGPRYLLPILPLLILPLAECWLHPRARRLTFGLIAVGAAIQLPGALVDFWVAGDLARRLYHQRCRTCNDPDFSAFHFFDPAVSDIGLQIGLLLNGRLDLAWITYGGTWLAPITLGLVVALACIGIGLLGPRSRQAAAGLFGLGGVLAAVAIVKLGWSAMEVVQPQEIMFGEGTIMAHAGRLLRGEPLYQPLDRPPDTIVAYTPLFHWVTAAIQALLGPGFGPGRVLSFAAVLVITGLAVYLAVRETGDRWAGTFAGLLFFTLGLPWIYPRWDLAGAEPVSVALEHLLSGSLRGMIPWISLYRVDGLGVALSLGAITLLHGGTTRRRVLLAAVLATLAFLTKQTLVAAGVAGVIWLWREDRSKAAIFAGTGLAITLVTGLALEISTGAFLANVVLSNVNPIRADALAASLGLLVRFQAGPLAIAGLYVVYRLRTGVKGGERLLLYFWIASLLPLVGLAKVGSNHNYWIETAAVTAVLATLGTWTYRRRYAEQGSARALVPILLIAANVTLVLPVVNGDRLPRSSQIWLERGYVEGFQRVVERVRNEPRAVLANPLDVLALAGRPILFEPYIFSILLEQGKWDAGPLVRRICGGEIGLVVLDQRLETDNPGYHGYPHWPAPVLRALRQTMTLEAIQSDRALYVPRLGAACRP